MASRAVWAQKKRAESWTRPSAKSVKREEVVDQCQMSRGRFPDDDVVEDWRRVFWLKDWIRTLSMVVDRVTKLMSARMLKIHSCFV